MAAARRWCVVAGVLGVLLALPSLAGARPARPATASVTTLLARVAHSDRVGYSGYAESVGGLALPVTRDFTDLTNLFGDRTRLRIWWRSRTEWRVDTVTATGETGAHRDEAGLWTWSYESNRAERVDEPSVRLPRPADLGPADVGRRLLSEARAAEISRRPAARVAGRAAAGLRLRPSDPVTSVDHVDIWVDPPSGLPVKVAVYAKGSARPAITSTFLDVNIHRPSGAVIAFYPPPDAQVRFEDVPDLAAAMDRFTPFLPPARLAGLGRRERVEGLGALGTYGRGVTVLAAVPLPGRLSGRLFDQLAASPGAQRTAEGVRLVVGPVGLLLTAAVIDGRTWLITGTVTAATLTAAARDLAAHPPGTR